MNPSACFEWFAAPASNFPPGTVATRMTAARRHPTWLGIVCAIYHVGGQRRLAVGP